jgi:hypothetical protein
LASLLGAWQRREINVYRILVGRPEGNPLLGRPIGVITNVINDESEYSIAPVSMSNTFQDLTRLRETADNTYI